MRRNYLDGLRGWASLFVLLSHLGPMFLLSTFKLPVTPFFMDGQLAVYIFFVLSGYVLSIGYFETGKTSTLKSLAIRRYPRLTIPIIASCSLAFLLIEIGGMHNIAAGVVAKSPWLESFYAFPASFLSMIKYSAINVYIDSSATSYNAVLWTMQYELFGSILVLGGLYALRGVRSRCAGYAISIAIVLYLDNPLAAFVFGVILADLSIRSYCINSQSSRTKSIATLLLLVGCLTLAMFRSGFAASPTGLSLIAAMMLASIIMSSGLRRAFSSPISLWLGHISFPLYLTHLLVICSVSSWVYLAATEQGYSIAAISTITALSTIVLSILAAMAFAPIESLAIKLSQRLSNMILLRQVTKAA